MKKIYKCFRVYAPDEDGLGCAKVAVHLPGHILRVRGHHEANLTLQQGPAQGSGELHCAVMSHHRGGSCSLRVGYIVSFFFFFLFGEERFT